MVNDTACNGKRYCLLLFTYRWLLLPLGFNMASPPHKAPQPPPGLNGLAQHSPPHKAPPLHTPCKPKAPPMEQNTPPWLLVAAQGGVHEGLAAAPGKAQAAAQTVSNLYAGMRAAEAADEMEAREMEDEMARQRRMAERDIEYLMSIWMALKAEVPVRCLVTELYRRCAADGRVGDP